MNPGNLWGKRAGKAALCACGLATVQLMIARPASGPNEPPKSSAGPKQAERQDDSLNLKPSRDLVLRPDGQRKADALAHYIEGMAFEENGETAKALKAYREVLNVDPG